MRATTDRDRERESEKEGGSVRGAFTHSPPPPYSLRSQTAHACPQSATRKAPASGEKSPGPILTTSAPSISAAYTSFSARRILTSERAWTPAFLRSAARRPTTRPRRASWSAWSAKTQGVPGWVRM